jgi:hypothetical protein
VLDHLLLAHDEAMLGVVDLAKFVDEEFLCVAAKGLPFEVLLTRYGGGEAGVD